MIVPAVGVLDRAGEELGGFLPRLGGALALLVVGTLLARLAARLLQAGLSAAGLDELSERWGVADTLARTGLGRSLTAVLARALRIGLTLVVVFAAASLLGLQFLDVSLNAAVLFLPSLLVAAVLLLAGVVLGSMARQSVDRMAGQMDLPPALGRAAQLVVVAVFAITAAAQIAVSTAILMALLAIVLATGGATLAIAFGLGGQGVARELSAGRWVRDAFAPGQEISVGDVRGVVVAVEASATVLRSGDGDTVRVPNDLLLRSMVVVHDRPEGPA